MILMIVILLLLLLKYWVWVAWVGVGNGIWDIFLVNFFFSQPWTRRWFFGSTNKKFSYLYRKKCFKYHLATGHVMPKCVRCTFSSCQHKKKFCTLFGHLGVRSVINKFGFIQSFILSAKFFTCLAVTVLDLFVCNLVN